MGALGKESILRRFDEIFVDETGAEANVRAAKYWLRLSNEYLILPDGTRWRPGKPRNQRFIIKPGESAFVSTRERLVVPPDLIGIIGPRYTHAEQGLLFFGGMLVDPGYGIKEGGEPLYFHIGNVGSKPFELRPGEDDIASLAFLEVVTPPARGELEQQLQVSSPSRIREELFQHGARERPTGALGLVEDINCLQEDVKRLDTSLHQVVLLGVIVLTATLLAAIIAALLGFDGKGGGPETSEPLWQSAGLTVAVLIAGAVALCAPIYGIAYGFLHLRQKRHTVRLRR